MRRALALCVAFGMLFPVAARALPVGYSFTVTTAFSVGNPFPNRLDAVFTELDTGFLQIENTGSTTFEGHLGITAVSAFAGDLSFDSGPLTLAPGAAVSIAVANRSRSEGGFNGPYFFPQPGIGIYMNGIVTDGSAQEAFAPLVSDRDIHSGSARTDPFGFLSDSFVLQGGNPLGFDTGFEYAVSQARGQVVLSQAAGTVSASEPVAEPASAALLSGGAGAALWLRRRRAAAARGHFLVAPGRGLG